MKTFEQMLKRLQEEKHIIVSLLFVNEFIEFCHTRGVYPSGGRILYEENAQFVYL